MTLSMTIGDTVWARCENSSQIISIPLFLHPDVQRKLKIYLQKVTSETRSKSCSRSKKQGLGTNIIPQNIIYFLYNSPPAECSVF